MNRSYQPAKTGECILRNLRVRLDESRQTTCGDYSLTEHHYDTCIKTGPTNNTKNRK